MKKLITLLVILSMGLGIYSYFKYQDKPTLYLNKASIDVEHGEIFNANFEDYIDTSMLNDDEKLDVINNTTITSEVDFKDVLLEIGKYPVKYKYKKDDKIEIREIMVAVADTLPPEFNDISVITTSVGNTIDYSKYIEATDYNGIESISFYAEDVDVERIGEYEMQVIAKDSSGNIAEKNIVVVVK